MDSSFDHFKGTVTRRKDRKAKTSGKFDWKKLKYNYPNLELDFPELSDSELDELKKDIRAKIKSDNRRTTILAVLFVLFLVFILFLLF